MKSQLIGKNCIIKKSRGRENSGFGQSSQGSNLMSRKFSQEEIMKKNSKIILQNDLSHHNKLKAINSIETNTKDSNGKSSQTYIGKVTNNEVGSKKKDTVIEIGITNKDEISFKKNTHDVTNEKVKHEINLTERLNSLNTNFNNATGSYSKNFAQITAKNFNQV